MPTLNYKLPYNINSDLVLSPEELDAKYFFGVDIRNGKGGRIDNDTKAFYIKNAQKEIENYLEIKLTPQIIKEEFDYRIDDFRNWSYVRTSYPVKKAFKMDGYISDILQIEYPAEWLKIRQTNDPIGYHRHIYLVPGGQTTVQTNNVIFNGITPMLGFFGNFQIPSYWNITYCSGFDTVPRDILSAIGYLSAIPLFAIAGDLIIGAGIASQSLGVDGLNQSISSTSSATNAGYGARIIEYRKMLDKLLPTLKDQYVGIKFRSI